MKTLKKVAAREVRNEQFVRIEKIAAGTVEAVDCLAGGKIALVFADVRVVLFADTEVEVL